MTTITNYSSRCMKPNKEKLKQSLQFLDTMKKLKNEIKGRISNYEITIDKEPETSAKEVDDGFEFEDD